MADGITSLAPLRFGTSTGGAAVTPDATDTLGVDRADQRTPPDLMRIWAAQLNAVKNFNIAVGQTFKSGTRLGCAPQTSNPFGATESGFYLSAAGTPYSVFNGSPVTLNGTAGLQVFNIRD
jgi:hypothetical protein